MLNLTCLLRTFLFDPLSLSLTDLDLVTVLFRVKFKYLCISLREMSEFVSLTTYADLKKNTVHNTLIPVSVQLEPLVFYFCQETDLRGCHAPIHEKTQVAPDYGLISLCTRWTLLQGLGIGYLMDPNMTS